MEILEYFGMFQEYSGIFWNNLEYFGIFLTILEYFGIFLIYSRPPSPTGVFRRLETERFFSLVNFEISEYF